MFKLLVYNIRKEKFAFELIASGVANRWNKTDEFVIYTGSSRALSILELAVHRAAINIDHSYKMLIIELSIEESDIKTIRQEELPVKWRLVKSYPALQEIGSAWYQSLETLILKIPSAVIPQEFNYLINTHHPYFKSKVHILNVEDFVWDNRLL